MMRLAYCLFISCFLFFQIAQSFMYVDFDASMKTTEYAGLLCNEGWHNLLRFMRLLYQNKIITRKSDNKTIKIPKLIQHVWFGNLLSEEYKKLRATWEEAHPDWHFLLWTDHLENDPRGTILFSFDEVAQWLSQTDERYAIVLIDYLTFDNRCFFDQACNYGERSDILKWEIVYRFGGVYIDTDFECLKPLEELHYLYDFYTGLQPLDTNAVQLGAALFAAKPGHPILHRCVTKIKDNQQVKQIIVKTGPLHFTKCLLSSVCQGGNHDVVLPASYFYPCGYTQQIANKSEWFRPEAYAVHHWHGSWLRPEAFVYS